MRKVKIAATQMACCDDKDDNIAKAEKLVRQAASKGARIILLQELFEDLYFCQEEKPEHIEKAMELEKNAAVKHFSEIAKELNVVLPISFFEKKNQARFNSVAVLDVDGTNLGTYRKTHIPDGPGYEEKYYFNPGDTGFKVWNTRYAKIGVGICWDQWFPETARCMAVMGAQILFYPTAIGSEPADPAYDSKDHWQMCMRGHSAVNIMPVVASNRVGTETFDQSEITFYGSSFITDNKGRILKEMDRKGEGVIVEEIDLEAYQKERDAWGLFRDRRPAQYGPLMTLDGRVKS
ncbi:MAG: N-carbamoylputrescine amidase [Desulfobacula sp.]|jgi:N-carbamoylputrescine amidase|uniref:N-carbamoylputrescine amidase n=1 Tax=Desulfobacula sp. TaxID=2593537 RepID=UPI001EC98ED4|nr:N-carbamoylputrescine amidase [Desulfobacula sp.]MBT4873677.1 N-carbamoylputrescine amidase [Desulfobacula sp.]MBT5546217.1 N-carbamoylputrescine amidase [Desulfobacula sp.]MBT6611273.1 N-carbamoylputrescine amidase [Deltaproteobacteria bacterium]MBT7713048.1 N-carbamoylputrescine amidase [Deltaproteobacteria bacterium]